MRLFAKHFTVEEANALIPFLREKFAQIHALLPPLIERREKMKPIFRAARRNGGGGGDSRYLDLSLQVQRHIAEILQKGVLIKDLERGLVDFPALRGDQEVFLCWELKEADEVRYWHDLFSGYAGRRPLED